MSDSPSEGLGNVCLDEYSIAADIIYTGARGSLFSEGSDYVQVPRRRSGLLVGNLYTQHTC